MLSARFHKSTTTRNLIDPILDVQADRRWQKLKKILPTGVYTVATANPGCHLQLVDVARGAGRSLEVVHPISLLAWAYRAERAVNGSEFNF
jgi:Fe-S oxidoreductase